MIIFQQRQIPIYLRSTFVKRELIYIVGRCKELLIPDCEVWLTAPPEFGAALDKGWKKGIQVLDLTYHVESDSLVIKREKKML